MKFSCITVDDEHLAHKLMADYISKLPQLELKGQFKRATDALAFILEHPVQIIFLDIQMPDLTGIQFLESLQTKPVVIFTTAYAEFALRGYELEVADYLLKPFTFERFVKAVNKAIKTVAPQPAAITQPFQPEPAGNDFLFVKSGYKSFKINFNDILYIEGLKEYVSIYTRERKFIRLDRLKSLEALLPTGNFMRVHKSYIAAIDKIETVYGNTIEIGGKEIPIGQSYKKNVEDRLFK
jgi:DNA-binding LytR/AlgR family response regulator